MAQVYTYDCISAKESLLEECVYLMCPLQRFLFLFLMFAHNHLTFLQHLSVMVGYDLLGSHILSWLHATIHMYGQVHMHVSLPLYNSRA
jgi:hypothetical protein